MKYYANGKLYYKGQHMWHLIDYLVKKWGGSVAATPLPFRWWTGQRRFGQQIIVVVAICSTAFTAAFLPLREREQKWDKWSLLSDKTIIFLFWTEFRLVFLKFRFDIYLIVVRKKISTLVAKCWFFYSPIPSLAYWFSSSSSLPSF